VWRVSRLDNASRLEAQETVSAVAGALQTLSGQFGPMKATYQDGEGRSTDKTYDLHRRLNSVTDTGNGVLDYRYDDVGNLRSVSRPGLGHVSMTHDSFGRMTAMTQPETGTTRYAYDDVGRVTSVSRANGRTIVTEPDLLGRTRREIRDGTQVTEYEYDAPLSGRVVANAIGRLVEVRFPLGTTTQLGQYRVLEYDALGRILREDRTVQATSGAHAFTYDDLGRTTSKTFPDLSQQVNEYSAGGGPIRRIRAVMGSTSTTIADFLDYAANGQLRTLRSGGWLKSYVYDGFERLFSAESRNGAGVVVQSYRYGYDGVGNIKRIEDLRPSSAKVIGGVDTSEDQAFEYDALYRLRTWTALASGGGVYAYDYDAGGNIVLKDGVTRTYSLCGVGAPERCITGLVGGVQQWRAVHDRGGDRLALEQTAAGRRWDYEYDASSRLTWARERALSGGAVRSSLAIAYDAWGDRVQKVYTDGVAATTTTIWLSKDFELRTTSRAGGISRTKHYEAPDGRRLASYTDGGPLPGQVSVAALPALADGPWHGTTRESVPTGWVFVHGNHLGSSSVTTNAAGEVLSRTVYAPFGEIIGPRSRGTDSTTTKFAGLELDEETGLHFASARYYDTLTARFLTADTVTPGEGQSSQGWNRYAYSRNNPVVYVDPSGHEDEAVQENTADSWQVADVVGALANAYREGRAALKGGARMIGSAISRALRSAPLTGDIIDRAGWAGEGLGNAVFEGIRGMGGRPTDSELRFAVSGNDVRAAGRAVGEAVAEEVIIAGTAKAVRVLGAVEVEASAPSNAAAKGGTYKLRDPETGQVRRTGRTNDLARREGEHGRNAETRDLDFEVDRRTDSYPEQRGREQRIYDEHPEADLNRKRPIDPRNPRRDEYLQEGDKL
jgi:RHS repeat-associated protein